MIDIFFYLSKKFVKNLKISLSTNDKMINYHSFVLRENVKLLKIM